MKNEKKKLKDVLDGKGNAVLKDKIASLESKLNELNQKEKETKTKERVQQKKFDDNSNELETLKLTMKTKSDLDRKSYQTQLDKMKLELTECWLANDELRGEVKDWKERY